MAAIRCYVGALGRSGGHVDYFIGDAWVLGSFRERVVGERPGERVVGQRARERANGMKKMFGSFIISRRGRRCDFG